MYRTIAAAFAALALSNPVYACKCRVIPYDEALAGTELAVEGTARNIVAAQRDGVVQLSARIRVHKRLKGPRVDRWVTVWTQGSTAACGHYFQEGVRQTFGLTKSPDGRWTTNSCIMNSLNQGR